MRVWIGEETGGGNEDGLVLLETNIDDMNPQIYGYLMERLFAEKAADVWFTPIQMKKNRPAVMLSVLAPSTLEEQINGNHHARDLDAGNQVPECLTSYGSAGNNRI